MRTLRGAMSALSRLWRDREVPWGWTAVFVPLPLVLVFALGSYSGDLLPWIAHRVSLMWPVVLALATVSFAGAFVGTEQGPPPGRHQRGGRSVLSVLGGARILALSACFFCVYLLSVVAWYIPDEQDSRRAGELTWWGAPVAVCLWALAAAQIANETEQSGSGSPANPARQWRWLVALRNSDAARLLAYVVAIGGAAVFAVAGSIPGLVWSRAAPGQAPAWRGHGYVTTGWYYFGFAIWAGLLLVAAALFLWHSFRARPLGLPTAVLRRAWYSLWASSAMVALMGCFVLAANGVLAEPLIDLAIAMYAISFAVLMVDASAATRHRRVKSSVPRRAVWAGGCILVAFAIAALTEPALGSFSAAILVLILAPIVPLYPAVSRGLHGIERLPPDAGLSGHLDPDRVHLQTVAVPTSPDERKAVYDIMLGREPSTIVAVDVLSHWRLNLLTLEALELPKVRNAPKSHPLVSVLFNCDDGIANTKKYPMPDDAPGILEALFDGDLDAQKFALIELMREQAVLLRPTEYDVLVWPQSPSTMEMLEIECIARLPGLPDSDVERAHWNRIRDMRLAWLFGKDHEWIDLRLDVPAIKKGKYHQKHGHARALLLKRACDQLMALWLANLETALLSASGDSIVDNL